MSNQGGLKHAATEPTRLDSKRERRRGAAGRASVLRRVPSDSDCSGETASLSADSGDRAPRPTPVARAGKNRGRRRGSEWEVLEGLKDGQRFDRKPEVFNGYLHKKRKWPLKGWHKRFFVVDAGILVYARSPSDVARGRLHGSVDVGLSVISAKARRRRIDIDADEFIYHLRAKTAEVFRTWLSILKAHRLYRQHLLTFGARESAPKTAHSDDHPTADGSSRTTKTSPIPKEFYIGDYDNNEPANYVEAYRVKSYVFGNKHKIPMSVWCLETSNNAANVGLDINNHASVCSVSCKTQGNVDLVSFEIKKCQPKKRQRNLNREPDTLNETLLYNISLDSKPTKSSSIICANTHTKMRRVSVPTYFFKASKRKPEIRKSCKCTNLCKYKNVKCEPKLQPPLYRCALLSNIQSKRDPIRRIVKDKEAQARVENSNKMVQDTLTAFEHDKIIEKLILSFINNNNIDENFDNIVLCMNDRIKTLYDTSSHNIDPLKSLFKGLLEFWLRNTSSDSVQHKVVRERSVDKPSHNRFTKDIHVSNKFLVTQSKETQYKGVPWNVLSKPVIEKNKANPQKYRPTRRRLIENNESTEKLESIIKNIVYICDTQSNRHRDLSITERNNNNVLCHVSPAQVDRDSQSELDALNKTITNFISNASLSSGIAREFFSALLNLNLYEKSATDSSSSKHAHNPECNVHAEGIHRSISKCVITDNCTPIKRESYFKEIFGKVSSVFMKYKANKAIKIVVKKSITNSKENSTAVENKNTSGQTFFFAKRHSYANGLVSPTVPLRGPQAGFVSGTPGGRLAGWIIESGGPLEGASRELGQAQLSVQQLQRLLDALEIQQQTHHDTDVSLESASPNVKKDRRKFGLRKKKSSSKCASVELAPTLTIDPSNSHMALSALTAPPSPGGGASSVPNSAASLPIACAAARPQSLPGAEALGAAGPASLTSLTPDHQLREDFTVLAKDLVASLKGIVATMERERGRLRAAMEASETTSSPGGAVVAALRTNLSSALQQNSELRTRLSRIHDASDLTEISSMGTNDPTTVRFQQSLSYSSSCVSASEFFDAEEHDEDKQDIIDADEAGVIELDGDSTSEAGSLSSEEGSASSDNSEVISAEQVTLRAPPRRARLPAPRPTPGGPSLWNLLYKNIGKDLSQISMPVTINEPLNMLQRLCEELEYSELLDSAAATSDSVERMCLIAAFAVSAYSASGHRAASKPFNPLLGETYECVRDDREFRFLAEQVSHHPPISACHAESPRWVFWQEARIKTKFWGKSMEFQPTGRVHARLLTTGDHYSWNKVTTCVHNLFGGQRWVDQYGDMHIVCHGTDISCKLNFIKASSWSSSRHEVRGAVTWGGGSVRVAGRWSEGLWAGEGRARCLYRPGAMPPDHELYYGFTRFAMELNELEEGMKDLLPHTDTRLRPDQRALELGEVERAESLKLQLEQAQRDRRRRTPDHAPMWFRKSLEDGSETWVFTEEYWAAREAGFSLPFPPLW